MSATTALSVALVLSVVDKVKAPLDRITKGSERLKEVLDGTRKQLQRLESAQRSVSVWMKQSQVVAHTSARFDEHREKLKKLNELARQSAAPTERLTESIRRQEAIVRRVSQEHAKHRDKLLLTKRRTTLRISSTRLSRRIPSRTSTRPASI